MEINSHSEIQDSHEESSKKTEETEKVFVQQFLNRYYLIKIQKIVEPLPENIKSALDSMVLKFIIKFFSIDREETNNIENLIREFLEKLKSIIRNFKTNEVIFYNTLKTYFTDFYSKITDLQSEKTLQAITALKSTFSCNPTVKKFLFIPDLVLEEEEQKFIIKMFETKTFTASLFEKEFIDTYKDFIIGYSLATKSAISDVSDSIFQDFNHQFEKNLSKTKNLVTDFLNSVITTVVPLKVNVLMFEISENQENNLSR